MMGDLLFYKASDALEWVIALGTAGPFAHVAIDIGGGRVVEAVPGGIRLGPPTDSRPIRYTTRPLPLRLSGALNWLRQQVGHPYGWEDIVGDVLRVFGLPVPWLPPSNAYDCSDLAVRFLAHANPRLVGPLARNPRLVSPNALAKHLGVK
jgi:hypothetical protein